MTTPRKAITDKMKIKSLLFHGTIHCPECELTIQTRDEIEWDHAHPICFDGPHEYQNIRPMHRSCHANKTIRDVKANAKVKRLEKERNGEPKRRRPKRKIQSRPFPKRAA